MVYNHIFDNHFNVAKIRLFLLVCNIFLTSMVFYTYIWFCFCCKSLIKAFYIYAYIYEIVDEVFLCVSHIFDCFFIVCKSTTVGCRLFARGDSICCSLSLFHIRHCVAFLRGGAGGHGRQGRGCRAGRCRARPRRAWHSSLR